MSHTDALNHELPEELQATSLQSEEDILGKDLQHALRDRLAFGLWPKEPALQKILGIQEIKETVIKQLLDQEVNPAVKNFLSEVKKYLEKNPNAQDLSEPLQQHKSRLIEEFKQKSVMLVHYYLSNLPKTLNVKDCVVKFWDARHNYAVKSNKNDINILNTAAYTAYQNLTALTLRMWSKPNLSAEAGVARINLTEKIKEILFSKSNLNKKELDTLKERITASLPKSDTVLQGLSNHAFKALEKIATYANTSNATFKIATTDIQQHIFKTLPKPDAALLNVPAKLSERKINLMSHLQKNFPSAPFIQGNVGDLRKFFNNVGLKGLIPSYGQIDDLKKHLKETFDKEFEALTTYGAAKRRVAPELKEKILNAVLSQLNAQMETFLKKQDSCSPEEWIGLFQNFEKATRVASA